MHASGHGARKTAHRGNADKQAGGQAGTQARRIAQDHIASVWNQVQYSSPTWSEFIRAGRRRIRRLRAGTRSCGRGPPVYDYRQSYGYVHGSTVDGAL